MSGEVSLDQLLVLVATVRQCPLRDGNSVQSLSPTSLPCVPRSIPHLVKRCKTSL